MSQMDLDKKRVHRDSPGHKRRTFFCCRDGAGRSESPAASRCHAGCRHWNRRCECSNSCYPGASCHLPHPGAHPVCTVKQSEARQPAHNGQPILVRGSLPACSLPRASCSKARAEQCTPQSHLPKASAVSRLCIWSQRFAIKILPHAQPCRGIRVGCHEKPLTATI